MTYMLILLLILAPVPKEVYKQAPPVSTIAKADNRDLRMWANDIALFRNVVEWVESNDALGGGIIDPTMRETLMAGEGHYNLTPAESRYWMLKNIREAAGGRKSKIEPDDK